MPEVGRFDPRAILQILEKHGVEYILIGGLAATLHGSPHVTTDVDITPRRQRQSMERLAAALVEMEARIRVAGVPGGVAFDRAAEFLQEASILNLTTAHGDLDLTFQPSGTLGYDDLRRAALSVDIGGVTVAVASLADIIRSKEAAGRLKDRLVLPTLRRLLEAASDG